MSVLRDGGPVTVERYVELQGAGDIQGLVDGGSELYGDV